MASKPNPCSGVRTVGGDSYDKPPHIYLSGGCGFMGGTHHGREAKDSIPPKGAAWKPSITSSRDPYGNMICGTLHPLDKFDGDLTKLPNGDFLKDKQVLIIRDPETKLAVVLSFVDREKEKALFGDEEKRGLKRIEFCIPEVFRKMTKEQIKEAKDAVLRNVGKRVPNPAGV